MNTKIMSSLSSSLQDRRSILESKTREPALRSFAENVKSKSESPPGSKGDGLFERELASQAQKEDRRSAEIPRPKKEERKLTAKTDKTENLRSHSGAGTESRKSKTEIRENRDQQKSDRLESQANGDRYSNEARRGISEKDSLSNRDESHLESRVALHSDGPADNRNEERLHEDSHETILSTDRFDRETSEASPRLSQIREAKHGEADADDEAVDSDAEQVLVAMNQSPGPKSLKDPKLLKQMQMANDSVEAMPLGTAAAGTTTSGTQVNEMGEVEDKGQPDFSPKQKAMLELLEGMQKELGVKPETMLKAFGDMSQASLEAPPQETLKDFIGKLTQEADLTPRESVKATAMYGKFLGEHAQTEFDETLDGLKIAGAIQDGSLGKAAMENLDQSVADLQVSLKGLQQKNQSPEQMQAEIARLMQLSQAMKAASSEGQIGKISSVEKSEDDEFGLSDLSGDSLKDFTVQNDKNLNAAVAGQGFEQSLGGQANGQGGSFANHEQSPDHSPGQAELQKSSTRLQVGSTGAKGSLRGEMEEALKKVDGSVNGNDLANGANASGASSTLPLNGKDQAAQLAGEGSILNPKASAMSSKDEEANVKELMRQAQLIVKKGGGEMKLEMSPEGMGKVHLRVGVENGQVNVQMLAESDAAKKMLENNLSDLRASLVAHKLHVDQLKVDTKVEANADISKQMDQQTRGDSGREQSRQFARDFMSEFRDDREGFRQGFFGDPKSRGYGRQARSEVKADTVSAMSARKTGTTSRLNVVA